MTQGYTDGMRGPLHIPAADDDTFRPTFGDLLKVLELPDLLTNDEFEWYRDQVRAMLGLGEYPRETYVDPDTPLPDYDPQDFS